MTLTRKINLLLVPSLLLFLAVAYVVVRNIADRTAFEESELTARLMMSAAQANPAGAVAKRDFVCAGMMRTTPTTRDVSRGS